MKRYEYAKILGVNAAKDGKDLSDNPYDPKSKEYELWATEFLKYEYGNIPEKWEKLFSVK